MNINDYKLPSLNLAKIRTKNLVKIEKDLYIIDDKIKNIGLNKYYFIRTYGCQANIRDSETLKGILEDLGYTNTNDEKNADLIIFNTCAIRENAENKVIGEIGNLKRLRANKPNLIFGLCGCMAQEEEVVNTILKKHKHVELIFGTHNINRLPQLLYNVINSKKSVEIISKEGDVIENLPVKRFETHKAWVNIMYGCDKFCTYCIVPYTRGKERSRLIEDVLNEVCELKKQGYKEITLLGQNVNAYGKDLKLGYSFAELLEKVAQTNIDRVRFTTSHPWDFTDDMVDIIGKYDNIMPYIHLPMQSGSNEILKLMGRRYTIEQYLSLYDKIKAKVPGCTISTDIIVGFPNETELQFLETLKVVDYCKFDHAYTFVYSPRTGTPAAKFNDNISKEIKDERLQRLNDKINKYARMNNDKYLNKTLKVLVDGISKKNKNTYSGYSEENKLVNFIGNNAHIGDIVEVLITDVKSWSLDGEQL